LYDPESVWEDDPTNTQDANYISSPEHDMVRAMFCYALTDLASANDQVRADAEAWISTDEDEHFFSAVNVADILKLNKDLIWKELEPMSRQERRPIVTRVARRVSGSRHKVQLRDLRYPARPSSKWGGVKTWGTQ
jgi:hypothetical protein